MHALTGPTPRLNPWTHTDPEGVPVLIGDSAWRRRARYGGALRGTHGAAPRVRDQDAATPGALSRFCGNAPGYPGDIVAVSRRNVRWSSHGTTVTGTVEEKITGERDGRTDGDGASEEKPQYRVRSDKTGRDAVHKPDALHRRSSFTQRARRSRQPREGYPVAVRESFRSPRPSPGRRHWTDACSATSLTVRTSAVSSVCDHNSVATGRPLRWTASMIAVRGTSAPSMARRVRAPRVPT